MKKLTHKEAFNFFCLHLSKGGSVPTYWSYCVEYCKQTACKKCIFSLKDAPCVLCLNISNQSEYIDTVKEKVEYFNGK